MTEISLEDKLMEIAIVDGRYHLEAYRFIFDSLDFVFYNLNRINNTSDDRHITVDQLLGGVKEYALDQFGSLSKIVLEEWGISNTVDIGEIVFNLVEGGLLNKHDSDNKSDFIHGFDFHEVFEEAYVPQMPW